MNNVSRVLYIHIPKTAGTSLISYMRSHFPKSRFANHIQHIVFKGDEAELKTLEKKEFISAHLNYSTLKRIFDLNQFFTITIFRDPKEQFISHLAWIKRLAAPQYRKEFESVPDYVKAIVTRMTSCNILEFLETLTVREKEFFDNCQTRYLLPYGGDVELSESHLLEALTNLEHVDLVGVTDRLDDFVTLIDFYMGWRDQSEIPVQNVSDRAYFINVDTASDDLKDRIAHLTRFDSIVYDHARTLHAKEMKRLIRVLRIWFPELSSGLSGRVDAKSFTSILNQIKDSRRRRRWLRSF